MRRKKKKTNRSPKAIVALIVLFLLAYVGYEPLNNAITQPTSPATVSALAEAKNYIAEAEAEGNPASTESSLSDETHDAEVDRAGVSAEIVGSLKADAPENVEIPAKLTDRPEVVLKRKTYTVSYNKQLNLPNWVAWELNEERLVDRESRTNDFLPDPDLPASEAVTTDDYKGSGYDRGHMCPAADNKWHRRAMMESFYMTNICPQHHNLNRGDWKELEDKCRLWAQQEGSIYIVCGPILYNKEHTTIGKQHTVTVPEAFFKVVLCLTSDPPKAIGFIYKNTQTNKPLDSYVNSVDEVERITGIDFFPALPDNVEDEVEATYDLQLWN